MLNKIMPSKNKGTTRSAKKRKDMKKNVSTVVTSEHESDWTFGEEEPSMKDMFQNFTAMMTLLSTEMDQMDGEGRKKRKVAFHSCATVPNTSSPPDATSTAASQPPTSLVQPPGHHTVLTSTPAVTKPLPPPGPELMCQEATYQEGTPPPLKDVSEAVMQSMIGPAFTWSPRPVLAH